MWFHPLRISFIILLAFTATPYARAQQPQIDALAARVVEELNKTHEKTVIVFDLVGPNKKSTPLGQKIADDFSDALTKSSATFSVIDHSQINRVLETNRLSPDTLHEPEIELWLAKKLRAGLMVLGELVRDGEHFAG